MPVTVRKRDGYQVTTPGGTKSKGTSLVKAARQARLLRAVDHGWKPTGRAAKEEQLRRVVKQRRG